MNENEKITVLAQVLEKIGVSVQNTYSANKARKAGVSAPTPVQTVAECTQTDVVGAFNVIRKCTSAELSPLADIILTDGGFYASLCHAPVKKFKRCLQGLLFAVTGNPKYIQGSVKTALIALCLALADADLSDRVTMFQYVNGNALTSGALPFEMAQTVKKVLRTIGTVKPNTSATQLSVAYGGESPLFLAWRVMSENGKVLRNSKVLHLIMKQLSKLSDTALSNALIFKKASN